MNKQIGIIRFAEGLCTHPVIVVSSISGADMLKIYVNIIVLGLRMLVLYEKCSKCIWNLRLLKDRD